jgi:hypothetical protein
VHEETYELAYAQLGYDDVHSNTKLRTSTSKRILAKTVALTDAMTAGGPRELQVLLYPLPRVKRLSERASVKTITQHKCELALTS